LHQDRAARYVAPDMDSAMGRDAGYPKASALLRGHVLWKRSDMIQRNHGKLCGRAEWAIGLCAVTPHSLADPIRRYSFADLIYMSGTIAMRNNPRVCHPEAEGVLPLLDIARVYAGSRDPNANFSR
jgi:hypothetical protein